MSPAKGWLRYRLPMLIILLAFALRIYRLGYQSIWWDEGRNIIASLYPLVAIPTAPGMDIHPPLYFYSLHFWLGLAGQSEFAARFLSSLFSLLTVALLFYLGRQLFDENIGLLAGLIAAFSPLFIHEAQEARMYSMALFFSTLSTLLLWRAWVKGGWQRWGGYVLAAAASLYTHYAAFFTLLVHNLVALGFILTSKERKRAMASWLASQGGIGLLYLPYLPVALNQAISYKNPNLVPPTPSQFVQETWQAFNTDLNVDVARVAPFLLGIGLILAIGMVVRLLDRKRDNFPPLAMALLWFLLPLALYYLLLQERSMFHPRYAMLVTPAYFLLLAYAIGVLWRRIKALGFLSVGVVICAFLMGTHSYYFDPRYFRDDTRSLAKFVEGQASSKDIVILDMPFPFQYYYGGPAPAHYLFANSKTIAETLTTLTQGREKAYLVQWYKSDSDPRGLIPFLLGKYGSFLNEAQFRGYRLAWYRLPPSPHFSLAQGMEGIEANFSETLALTQYAFGGQGLGETSSEAEVNQRVVPSGKFIWVVLNWRLLTDVEEDCKASLYLEDESGHLVGQDDRLIISEGHLRTSNWSIGEEALNVYLVPVAPGTPPGEYNLKVAVYKATTLERLTALAEGRTAGSSLQVGTIRVVRPTSPPPTSALEIRKAHLLEFPEMRLLGYDLPQTSIQPGGRLTLALYWQAKEEVEGDYLVHLSLEDKERRVWGEDINRPGLGNYPTDQWERGEIVKDWHDLRLSPEAPLGEVRLMLSLVDSATKEESQKVHVASLPVEGRQRLFTPPQVDHPLEFYLDQKVKLLGYNLEAEPLRPGGSLKLVLFWQALEEMEVSYTVFTHLLDGENGIWGQKDNLPGRGLLPTTGWVAGEIIVDEYEISLDPQAPEGDYTLEVGMYDAESGERLPVRDGSGREMGDRIILTTIKVTTR